MHLARTKDRLTISGSTKLADEAIRGVLTLAVLSALLFIAVPPACAQTEKVLYRFPNSGLDGKQPLSSLTSDGKGNLYGTTSSGGTFGAGTVFELSPNGGYGHKLWRE